MSLKAAVKTLSFATSVAAALSITACSPRPQSRACVDGAGTRLPDSQCNNRSGGGARGAGWYYGGNADRARVGETVRGGSRVAPRGGFGSSARGSVGG